MNPIDHKALKSGAFANPPTRRPCIECPLRRDSVVGHLGGYTPEQYIDVLNDIGDIACHLSPGFPRNPAEQRSCTGVAMYRANLKIAPLARNSQAAVDHVGENREIVFDDPADFLAHHHR
jgi:hypothetical protein